MSRHGSMVRSTLLLTLANLLMRAVSMAFQVYLTGQVGAAGIGLLQLIMTVHGFAITVGTSGLRVGAMYLSAEEHGHGRPAGVRRAMMWCLGVGLALSAAVGAGMALGAELLALNWVGDLRAAASLRLLGLTLPLTCLSAILAGYFTAVGQVGRLVLAQIGDRMATVLATVWLLGLGVARDLTHACLSIVGGGAVASLGSVAVLLGLMLGNFRHIPRQKRPDSMGERLRRLCVPVALNDYLRSGLGTLEQLLIPYGLTRCGGSRTGALAAYGTIQGMVFPVMMFPSTVLFAVSDLLVPRLALCRARRDDQRICRLTRLCLHRGLLFAAAVAGGLYLLADPLGQLLFHSVEAGKYLRVFAPLAPVLYLDCIVDGMHKGLGQQVYCVRVNTLTNLLDVIGLFFLLPRWGVGGYIFTYTVTHCINFWLSLRRLMQISGAIPAWRPLVSTIGAVLGSVALCRWLLPLDARWPRVLLGGGIYLTVTACLLLLTGGGKHLHRR